MSKKIALLFPGQGSQYVGMGQELNEKENLAFTADKVLGYPLSTLMLKGPIEELTMTFNAQPAIVTHSISLFNKVLPLLAKYQTTISLCLGHSVGEYSALVASGSLSLEEALKAVHFRGKAMQEAVPVGAGKMFAILRAPVAEIEEACKNASDENEQVMPANYNEPGQIVISGHANACQRALDNLTAKLGTSYRSVELNVSAPFHSELMEPAAKQMASYLDKIEIKENNIPYISNIDAKINTHASPTTIKENLVKQVAGSVLWYQSFEKIPDDVIALEVGPGKTLTGMARRINPKVKILALDKQESFAELEELLK